MKKLIFVTSKYPFCNGETFIENEIGYLAKAFDKVFIYATEAHSGEPTRPVPDNVSFFAANAKPVSKKDYFPCLFKPRVIKEIFKNCLKGNVVRKISACCYQYCCFIRAAKGIPEFLSRCSINEEDTVSVYSYWLNIIGMCAVEIKKALSKSGISSKTVSRCHGFDVYSEVSYADVSPFQEQTIHALDRVFPCSKCGTEYLIKKYPAEKDKIQVAYLGVKDMFCSDLPKRRDVFSIISCSNVIPLKRVDRIAEALSQITDREIIWMHFGDGEAFAALKAQVKSVFPKNVRYDFKGRVPNSEIFEFYANSIANLFINVSESEGLPVSIMEATSFGVPVIATDVGGTGEIVIDGKNGFLLKKDFSTAELKNLIMKFIDMSDEEYYSFCKESRKTFQDKFDARKNYSMFYKNL